MFAVLRDQSELENGILFHQNFSIFMTQNATTFFGRVVYYFYAFTQVKDLERDLSNAPDNEHIKMQLKKARKP